MTSTAILADVLKAAFGETSEQRWQAQSGGCTVFPASYQNACGTHLERRYTRNAVTFDYIDFNMVKAAGVEPPSEKALRRGAYMLISVPSVLPGARQASRVAV